MPSRRATASPMSCTTRLSRLVPHSPHHTATLLASRMKVFGNAELEARRAAWRPCAGVRLNREVVVAEQQEHEERGLSENAAEDRPPSCGAITDAADEQPLLRHQSDFGHGIGHGDIRHGDKLRLFVQAAGAARAKTRQCRALPRRQSRRTTTSAASMPQTAP